jgi:glycine cleavage system H protein
MTIAEDRLYNKDHLWCLLEDNEIVVAGISDHARSNLGEIAFLELPGTGTRVTQNKSLGIIESVKVVNELMSPVNGTVIETNDRLTDSPTLVNDAPYGDGWILRIRIDSEEQFEALMDASTYLDYIS